MNGQSIVNEFQDKMEAPHPAPCPKLGKRPRLHVKKDVLKTEAMRIRAFFVCCGLLVSCQPKKPAAAPPPAVPRPFDAAFVRLSAVEIATLPLAERFDPPMGAEQWALVYDAQPFRTTRHLGADLNGIGGWNSDLGDPVFASGTGRVVYCGVPSPGWGNMIILAHRVPDKTAPHGYRVVETVYAHMLKMLAQEGDSVRRGQKIGEVGTANGHYFSHLHFEVRESRSLYPGPGYSDAPLDRVSPQAFLAAHSLPQEDPAQPAP